MESFIKFVIFYRKYCKDLFYIAFGTGVALIVMYMKGGLPGVETKILVSLILGMISLSAWYIPLFGVPISIVGLIFGIIGFSTSSISFVIAGIAMSLFGLILSLFNAYLGAKLS